MAKRPGNPGLRGKLLNKSMDAYIMSLETINRISVAYRIEAFTYLICNAWELLLKARILDIARNRRAIFYKRTKDPVTRSLSLADCLAKIYPDEKDPIRRNIERVRDLRDAATHLVIVQIPKDLLALLQACVLNYHKELGKWFDISLSDKVPIGMMTIVYDLTPDQFSSGAQAMQKAMDKDTVRYLARLQKEVNDERAELGGVPEFSIVFDYRLALAKKSSSADVLLTHGEHGEPLGVVETPRDPARTHPYRQKELINRVNDLLDGSRTINSHDVQCICKVFTVEKRPDFRYQGAITGSPVQYSEDFAQWIVAEHLKKQTFFSDCRTKARSDLRQKK